MANNNRSRAQKAADNKKKTTSGKSGTNHSSAKKSTPKVTNQDFKSRVSHNAAMAVGSLILFILFLVISINPDGVLLQVLQSFFLGLFGKVGFYFAIPAFAYIFVIHTFGKKTNVRVRTACVIAFVLLCGCISHLSVEDGYLSVGSGMIATLYKGGADGSTGGLVCGGIAMFARWGCGTTISYIIFIVAAVLSLLGAMQITVFSLAAAIKNRPRDEFEDAEEEEEIDPASVVVNHIANKKIERARQRRQRQEEANQPVLIEEPVSMETPVEEEKPVVMPVPTLRAPIKTGNPRVDDMMNQIDGDIGTPVAAAAAHVTDENAGVEVPRMKPTPMEPEQLPVVRMPEPVPEDKHLEEMPQLEVEQPAPVADVPVLAPEPEPKKVTAKDTNASARQVAQEIAREEAKPKPAYCFPPIDLLDRPSRGGSDGTAEMRENSRRLNETLASFNIDAHIINVTRGPSVTRYEVELDKGVRLSKLTGCADDIALSLGASGVRIAAVPGKISVVGIEVPNRTVTTVSLREVINSSEFEKAKSLTSIALGKSIDGNCVVGNVAKMPHLLIAGTTGSGKSVCMNSIIISLLYKAGPEDVKLIMVDPKMVELGIYNGIPQLLIPVVTDPKKAAGSLQWAVTEMLRRYKMMSDLGVRDLESYNSIVVAEDEGQKLPKIVIIIDELADLMMVAAKEVEDSICRIAQMGRAAGMHLIIATQRPSANVITGLMKANIPSRIAFSVASAMESRIILDTMGAEKLVGKGDMLYAPIGSGKPLRVQGCFVSDSEVESVASYVKQNYAADYDKDVLKDIERNAQQTGKKPAASVADPEPTADELGGDEMLPAAVDVILETGQASVSMLQRRLKLGYARAARIVDEMEEKGIVGPFQGSKPRAILVTKEQWAAMKNAQPQQMEFDDLEDFSGDSEDF
jgi:S-DNA-T family DNA segregation ATPase FtsK/SpoIIIE